MDSLITVLILACAVGAGLMAGMFFAFSNSVMGALAKLPADQGAAAMQHINAVILNPVFFIIFFGTAVVSVVLAVLAVMGIVGDGAGFVLAGCGLYLITSMGVTMVFNVPLNQALAAVDATSAEGAKAWADYLSRWTMWNHVRTLGNTGALAALILALN